MRVVIDEDVIAKSIETYGTEKQSIVCMEECAELIQCISKELRGKSNPDHLTEEIADVLICIEMLKQMYHVDLSKIQTWIDKKQNREESRMKSHE